MRDYLIDGVSLRQREKEGWFLTWEALLPAPANTRTMLVEVPFMDGAIGVRGGAGTGSASVELVVRGEGGVLDERVSKLVGLLTSARTLTRDDNGRLLHASILQTVVAQPQWSTSSSTKITATFTLAPTWVESEATVSTQPAGADGVIVFPEFEGCTGVLSDAVVTCTVIPSGTASGYVDAVREQTEKRTAVRAVQKQAEQARKRVKDAQARILTLESDLLTVKRTLKTVFGQIENEEKRLADEAGLLDYTGEGIIVSDEPPGIPDDPGMLWANTKELTLWYYDAGLWKRSLKDPNEYNKYILNLKDTWRRYDDAESGVAHTEEALETEQGRLPGIQADLADKESLLQQASTAFEQANARVEALAREGATVSAITLTHPSNGSGVSLPGTIDPTHTMVVDIPARSANHGGKPVRFDYPRGGFLRLEPVLDDTGKMQIRLKAGAASNVDALMVSIRARRSYR